MSRRLTEEERAVSKARAKQKQAEWVARMKAEQPERLRGYGRQYYHSHKAVCKARHDKWAKENYDRVLETNRRSYRKHRTKRLAERKAEYDANSATILARSRAANAIKRELRRLAG